MKKLSIFRQIGLVALAVIMIASFGILVLPTSAVSVPVLVTRGGTGLNYIPGGYSLWGDSINNLTATSTMTIASDGTITMLGALVTPQITISAVSTGNMGIGTSTPATVLDVYSTGTSTMAIDTDDGARGSCLKLVDTLGSRIYCYVKNGGTTFTCSTIDCQ